MSIFITILTLGLLIFIHELGHYLIARYFGVKIETFSIGFGPKLFSFNKQGTDYVIALIPLGGFVKMKGQGDIEAVEDSDADSFSTKAWWQRALIVFAGPVFNLFLATVLLTLSFLIGRTYTDLSAVIYSVETPYTEYFQSGDKVVEINGVDIGSFSEIFRNVREGEENRFVVERGVDEDDWIASSQAPRNDNIDIFIENRINFFRALTPVTLNIIGDVSPGMPAWRAGVREGDRVLMVDGVETNNWSAVRNNIANSTKESIVLTIQRDERLLEITVIPEMNPLLSDNSRIIGITQAHDITIHEKQNLFESIRLGVLATGAFVYMNYHALYVLIRNPGNFKNSVGGPIMIHYMTAQTSQRGIGELLLFMAALSILLMIMNLLPIPVFDGGHILFFLFEGIFKRPIPIKVQTFLQHVGLLILLSLMIFAFYSDTNRFFQRATSNRVQNIEIVN